jgi:hypothetical protein
MKINKKFVGLMLIITVFMLALMPVVARADWSVTVTWTRSTGPNLASEAVLLDAATKCTITATAPTTCQFNVTSLTGQAVKVRSFNSQGAFAETAPVVLSTAPAPATGVMINVTYIQP